MRALSLTLLFIGCGAIAALALPQASAQPAQRTGEGAANEEANEEGVSGVISSEGARTEILPEPPPVGARVEIPGGWYRVESGETEEGATGSLSVVATPPPAAPAPQQQATPQPPAMPQEQATAQHAPPPAAPQRPTSSLERPCFAEKNRYAKELFRIAGIWSFEHPLALIEALEDTPGLSLSPWVRFNLFGLGAGGPLVSPVGVDPIRPLGWDEGLRWAADDLVRCATRSRSGGPTY